MNNTQELKAAIENCSKEEYKRRCNNVLVECTWKVTPVEGFPNEFENDIYKIDPSGTVKLHHDDAVFFGTWVTLYIGDQLYLNIDLNDNAEAEGFWDHNWEIEQFNDTQISISNDGTPVLIEKDCSTPCNANAYQVCELYETPGFAIFDFTKFTHCIPIPPTHDVVSAVGFSFFETEEEAMNNVNAVSAYEYINIENPQTIFVRLDYETSGKLLDITQITIEAIICIGT